MVTSFVRQSCIATAVAQLSEVLRLLRECYAEFLGTFVVISFGIGVNNQVVLSDEKDGTWLSINMAWGIAVLMGVYCSEGVSGGHLNPSVTLAHAVYGRLPWRKVPGYMIAQFLGAFVGAVAIYLLDYQRLRKADPDKETMYHNFATHPIPEISNLTAFYTEALATGLLLLCVYAITDRRNRSPGTVGTPFAFALMIMALGMSFGMNTGYAMNPARDFSPRLLTFFAGYGSKVFTENGCYFLIPPDIRTSDRRCHWSRSLRDSRAGATSTRSFGILTSFVKC
ncbi:hypothetical protein PHMEG_00030036 [Phytophthora megakarya]|uniref:Aquaporin n=1 Tax=Phytophthora megakarya TaxID=4795 RepID=A0A225UZS5_9STRA|nr:hypothetical protein PHMEG_00030036 [Phytophthora megakarya]